MKSYPYIGINEQGTKALFFSINNQVVLSAGAQSVLEVGRTYKSIIPAFYKNITREYLKNTYGIVESKEHAESIVELAEVEGFLPNPHKPAGCFFYIAENMFGFGTEGDCSIGAKQITIPLPPKEPLKNAGDNLILGCEDSKYDEWPQVGDDVIAIHPADQLEGKLLALTKEYAIISQGDGEQHLHLKSWDIKKPKTPEEELRDDVAQLIDGADGLSSRALTWALMDKYNITKKPQ